MAQRLTPPDDSPRLPDEVEENDRETILKDEAIEGPLRQEAAAKGYDLHDSDSATVWVAHCLLTLTGFQFVLVKHDLCDSYEPMSINISNATVPGSPSCGFSGAVLALI